MTEGLRLEDGCRKGALRSGYILVVEDDPDIRELLVDLLGVEGFDARGAMHGKDALEQLEKGYVPTSS